jgi:hypothetical protein
VVTRAAGSWPLAVNAWQLAVGTKGQENLTQQPVGFEGGFGPKGLENLAQEPVGFERGFGPKGLGNSAQALAWVAPPKRRPPRRGVREEVLRSDEIIKGIFADKRRSAPFLFSSRWQGLNAFILLHPG